MREKGLKWTLSGSSWENGVYESGIGRVHDQNKLIILNFWIRKNSYFIWIKKWGLVVAREYAGV